MENTVEQKENKNSTFLTVATFLCLEVFAFVAFSLGNSFITYGILGVVLLIILLIVNFKSLTKDGSLTASFFIFPIFIYGLLSALSSFSSGLVNYDGTVIYSINVGTRIFVPIAFLCYAIIGYLLSTMKTFKLSTFFLVIYSSLALLTLINLFAMFIQFEPFYTITHKTGYLFFNGEESTHQIGELAYSLVGFSFLETSITYFSFAPSLLLSSAVALFFLSFKNDKKLFIVYSLYTLLAFITLLFVPSKATLLTDFAIVLLISLVVCTYKFAWKWKYIKIPVYILIFGFALFFIIELVIAQSWGAGLYDFISGIKVFNRVFIANRFSDAYLRILNDLFSMNKILGFPLYSYTTSSKYTAQPTGSFFFDNFMTSGVAGALFFLAALILGLVGLVRYVRKGEDSPINKAMLVTFILTFFGYNFINLAITPLEFYQNKVFPFFTNSMLLIIITLLSYLYNKGFYLKEKKAIKKVQEEEMKIRI